MKRQDVNPIPQGYSTITPALTVQDGERMIEFYKKAFGAEERGRMTMPDGKGIAHAELKIGNSIFMLADEMPGEDSGQSPRTLGGVSVSFYLYVENVDKAFERAVAAGATVKMAVEDMFWGDRMGTVVDPCGHMWSLATHVEEISPEEIEKRGREAFEKMLQTSGQT